MDNFKITDENRFKALFLMVLEINIAIKTQNTFLVENIKNGRTDEENIKDFSEIGDQVRSEFLNHLYVQFGDLDLGDLLSGK